MHDAGHRPHTSLNLYRLAKENPRQRPYLRLGTDDDTRLSVLMLRVSYSFLRDQGIYYVLQPSIGQDMILATEDRLISYREFCNLLRTPERRIWLHRLIAYYLETGRGAKLDRVTDAITAIEALSALLDLVTGGGESARSRLAAEGITSLQAAVGPVLGVARAATRVPGRSFATLTQAGDLLDAAPTSRLRARSARGPPRVIIGRSARSEHPEPLLPVIGISRQRTAR